MSTKQLFLFHIPIFEHAFSERMTMDRPGTAVLKPGKRDIHNEVENTCQTFIFDLI